ncbi:MAG: glycoside hydrolase family 3 protein [Treponema sp.]|nr:glycoside hydrolase family 3 protein [Treponema sp.]
MAKNSIWKSAVLAALLVFMAAACKSSKNEQVTANNKFAGMTVAQIVESLSLEQKVSQMLQPAVYNISESDMKKNCYGSVLSHVGSPEAKEWRQIVDGLQKASVESDAQIPFIFGQDDVHGVNFCLNAVYFPHNIGLGAGNNPDLMYKIGLATADEAKICHMLWNFAPCVAQSEDPRWGRTYESYGSNLEIITNLSTAYTKGLVDGGVIACPKHFLGDGNVEYGTGDCKFDYKILDRGNSVMSDDEIEDLLKVYEANIEAGALTIMTSFSSMNGVKMHENKKYIDYLKKDLGFKGFIISDWNGIQLNKEETYRQQIIASINAGVDMMMEVDRFEEAMEIVVNAVKAGDISTERIDDAVSRILYVKKEAGIFDDPLFQNLKTVQSEPGSEEYRKIALQAVEESLVLLKNENNVLPLKKGTKVFVTGPAASNSSAQCGGWTIDWNESSINPVPGVTTIAKGFSNLAKEGEIEEVTYPDEADVIILCVGEKAYAEWNGDSTDMDLCGEKGLEGNKSIIKKYADWEKPVVACIVAGRQVIIKDYIDNWDAAVMCYLPGSEGQGVANVLTGKSPFKGKLPSPWYESINQIGTDENMFPAGWGL